MALSNSGFKLIKAARLIDGKSDRALERGAILIEGDLIRAVGPEEEVVPPEGRWSRSSTTRVKPCSPALWTAMCISRAWAMGAPATSLPSFPTRC